MELPHDVLVKIASLANARTQLRMRTASRALYANSSAHTKPLSTGYAYGTGALQKDYNELPKILRKLAAQTKFKPYPGAPIDTEWSRLFMLLRFLVGVMKAYRAAAKQNRELAVYTDDNAILMYRTSIYDRNSSRKPSSSQINALFSTIPDLPQDWMRYDNQQGMVYTVPREDDVPMRSS